MLQIDYNGYGTGAEWNQRTKSRWFVYDFKDWRVDLTLRGEYAYEKRRLFGGVNYAPGRSVALLFGGTLHGLDIAYSYEAFTSGLGLGAGQHEISLIYRLPIDLGKKGRNLHRSVRWL